jgi:hypothetical protein
MVVLHTALFIALTAGGTREHFTAILLKLSTQPI